ncbi:tRNA1(Val) (adenine(37)-N6)-methyltransferase [Rhodalgimonas zhirmunskyi]|uniref:Methyltransferase n=1 Tax=Rhodalgimonas zhirmunskyi TaxID=2964767 RepID=A0AAJ1U570_9RHOB|nr:methyltransferase [Rhodoalgimonas zhirmunskyi]MDQ2093239.1 methyltransferase [Rhodoalgimonas zhirmunskyi]
MNEADLTRDDFLGGRITLAQPRRGYRAGIDPVLLAASVTARDGQAVLELGCGVGAAALCLAARVPGLSLTGLERDPSYAGLARRNAEANKLPLKVVEGDLANIPTDLRQRRFDLVLMNPPYYDRGRGSRAPNPMREVALGEETPLSAWIVAAARRLLPGGYLHVIQRADRLGALLAALDARAENRLGSVQVMPLLPRPGRDARLVLLRARKEGRAPLRLHAGILLHPEGEHPGDRENYTKSISSVLRDGAQLEFPR